MASGEDSAEPRFASLRTGVSLMGFTIMLLVGFFWIQSYFTGYQSYRSNWHETETGVAEKADWLFSNYGSFGFAWRRQFTEPRFDPPDDARESSKFDASHSAVSHIHPEGFGSWHWIHFAPTVTMMLGSTRHEYGHLFVPYWIPFLAFLLLVIVLNLQGGRERNLELPVNADDPEDDESREPAGDSSGE